MLVVTDPTEEVGGGIRGYTLLFTSDMIKYAPLEAARYFPAVGEPKAQKNYLSVAGDRAFRFANQKEQQLMSLYAFDRSCRELGHPRTNGQALANEPYGQLK